ncbi:MAG TPA: hypothetical protein PKW91_06150, partial [Rectinema sp.]|nr:hypothetical protein [Rectinema sp.]
CWNPSPLLEYIGQYIQSIQIRLTHKAEKEHYLTKSEIVIFEFLIVFQHWEIGPKKSHELIRLNPYSRTN